MKYRTVGTYDIISNGSKISPWVGGKKNKKSIFLGSLSLLLFTIIVFIKNKDDDYDDDDNDNDNDNDQQ
jgi:hypothetical protein